MLSPNIKKMLDGLGSYKENAIYEENNGPVISVNNLTGKVGTLYEKIRYLIDYKEEHTIRRSAIERILKRNILIENNSEVGLSLLRELIGSGYLPNKSVPESMAGNIQIIVNKYLILGTTSVIGKSQLISLMSSEIERFLFPQLINDLVVDWFYSTISNSIIYTETTSSEDLRIQTYIGCRRCLLEDDRETLLYSVLMRYIPELDTLTDEIEIENITSKLSQTILIAKKDIENPLSWKISSKLRNYSVYFSVIKQIIKEYGLASEHIFSNQSQLDAEIKKILSKKYEQHREVTDKSGTRAIEYIFLTKILLALAIEFPYEKFILLSVDYFALGINIIFHPLLLLFMVKTIKPASPNNTNSIINGIRAIVQNEDVEPNYIKSPNSNFIAQATFGLLYAALCAISFGLILWILELLHFSIISKALFLLFLTLVSYFGFRIRHNARKWKVFEEDDRILTLLWNFFTFPIINAGRWLSRKFSSINIFVFAMDIILETPFKFILGTFDSFIYYLKEKGEDSY